MMDERIPEDDLLTALDAAPLGADEKQRIAAYIDLVLGDQNAFYSVDELRDWFDAIRATSTTTLQEKGINELRDWVVDPDTGNISHRTGEFFSVIGLEIGNANREVRGWDQPIVYQKEMGVLGLIRTKFDGVWHYLLHAKAEPGNTLLYQLSPTLQATYSNLKAAHGGRVPRFAEFFRDDTPGAVVYRQWLAEDGGRFYKKSNLNMLVEVKAQDLPEIPADYRWFTLSQIKALLMEDNYINPHVRSILCHL